MNMEFVINNRIAKALRELGLISEWHETKTMSHMEAMTIVIGGSSYNNVRIYEDFSGAIINVNGEEIKDFNGLDDMIEQLIIIEHNYKF